MKALKRAFALLLVGAMALTVAACGSDDGGNSSGGKKDNETSANMAEYILDSKAFVSKMPEELKNTKLTLVNWYDTETNEEKEIIDAFEAQTGIEVTTRVVAYQDYINTVAGLLAAGETPDVMRMREPVVGTLRMLQDIKGATGFNFEGKEWDEHIIRNWSFKDKTYGVNLVYTPYMMGNLLVYNTDTMKEMGYEDPWQLWKQGKWTWEKMKEMMIPWVEQGTDYIGSCIWPTDAPVVTRNGLSFTKRNEDGTYTLDLTNKEIHDAWKFIIEGRTMNLFTNLNDGVDLAKQKTLFGSMTASAVQGKPDNSEFNKLRRRGVFAVVPLPKWDDAEYCLPMYEFTAFGVPKGAKNPKAVPYFLAYLCNLDNYDLSVYNKDTSPEGFFYDQQSKDVYMELLSIKNRQEPNAGAFTQAKMDLGSAPQYLLFKQVVASDITGFLSRREPILKNSVEVYNEDVRKFFQ